LCGIGGRTIEEAKSSISYKEFFDWVAYRRKRGTLNVGMRVEHFMSIVSQMIANRYRKSNSPSYSYYDFATHHDEPELTIDDMKAWK
jgi:hypothetical protein